jgi:hypothetical protein
MTVSLDDISKAFDDLVAGGRTPETIAAWARSLMKAEDDGQLHYEPAAREARIWRAILYLTGVDLREGPAEYFHDAHNFTAFRKELGV